jgi:hypothetical protein
VLIFQGDGRLQKGSIQRGSQGKCRLKTQTSLPSFLAGTRTSYLQ